MVILQFPDRGISKKWILSVRRVRKIYRSRWRQSAPSPFNTPLLRAIIIESSKSEYRNIRLSDIRISAKSYIRVGPYYPKPILEQRIIGSIFEHERI